MRSSRRRALAAALLAAACARAPRPAAPAPEGAADAAAPAASPALPPVPRAEGPLAIRVQYPAANALIQSRDSNFIHGTVGHGGATLTVNGVPVPVSPNGAFLGWLPNPPHGAPHYELVAARGADTARLTLPVRLLPTPVQLDTVGPLIVDSSSVAPRGTALALRPDEPVRVSVRAAADAQVWVQWDSARKPLVSESLGGVALRPMALSAAGGASATTDSARRAAADTGGHAAGGARADSALAGAMPAGDPERWAADVPARVFQRAPTLVVARAGDTARFALPPVELMDPAAPRWALLGATAVPGAAASDTDRVVVGRPFPAGTYAWLLLPRTVAEVTGRSGEFVRVRLDALLEAWVAAEDVALLPDGYPAPRRLAGGAIRVEPAAGWVDVVVPMAERPPFLVEERGQTLVLTLYDTRLGPGLIYYLENDTLVRSVVWEQETSNRARLAVHLTEPPYGYLALWEDGRFVLRVRRPPRTDARRPLRGLTIAVDAGHPPAGATGPTGLYEGDAVLPVAERLRALLEERGARVVMTRTTPEPVPLVERPAAARRADAHALVSVHLNALPDGVNPFTANGTSVLFFHPHSEPLARDLQRALVRRFRLRDLGRHYQNIAIGRATWMPAVITEGLFIMLPEQEAAMRHPEGREAYARAIADGLEEFFRRFGERP